MTTVASGTPDFERSILAPKIAAFAAIYLLWGATFLALRYAVVEIPPLLTIAVRCAGGAALLFLILGGSSLLVGAIALVRDPLRGAGN